MSIGTLHVPGGDGAEVARGGGSPWSDLQAFVLDRRRRGFAANTVHGYAQVVKTLCRLGHQLGYIPEDITDGFEMPRVPRTIIPTFSDEQLEALLAAPDKRTWVGIRDRAILLVLLDTLIRVSELVGLDAGDVDVDEGAIRVMGKGRKERAVPFGRAAAQAPTSLNILFDLPIKRPRRVETSPCLHHGRAETARSYQSSVAPT